MSLTEMPCPKAAVALAEHGLADIRVVITDKGKDALEGEPDETN